jgi:hypothetical protein
MALHPETNVQRGTRSAEKTAEHHEKMDAPPGRVVAVTAAFLSIVLIGLAIAAGTIEWRDARHGIVMHDPPAPLFANASLPPLLADPGLNRREVEAEARSHLDPAKLEAAMRQVEQHKGKRQ